MKNFLLIILFISLLSSITAQSGNSEADSLVATLSLPLDDTTRMNTWQKLGYLLFSTNSELSRTFADSLLNNATIYNYSEQVGHAYRIIALVQYINNNIDSAVFNINMAIPKFESIGDSIMLGKAYSFRGSHLFLQGKKNEALKSFLTAHYYLESKKLDHALSKNYNNIGIIYRLEKQYQKALQVYKESLKIKTKLNDSSGIANTYYNMGVTYGFLKENDEALKALKTAKRLYGNLKAEDDVASVDLVIGIKQIEMGYYENGIEILESSITKDRDLFDATQILSAYKAIGKGAIAIKDFDKALLYLEEGYSMVKETNNQGAIKELSKLMSIAYAGQNRFREAYLYSEKSSNLNDTLYLNSKVEAQEEMETRFETKLKEKTIALQDVQIAQQKERSRLYLIIASLLGLIVLAFGVLGYFLRKSRKELADKNKIISNSLDEKEMLLKEIHHRVKNNLQVISSLLSLQSQTITDETAHSAILEGRNRVKSMALIHQNLYQDENLSGVNAAEYISKLTENLFSSYRVDHDNIQFQHQVAPVSLDVDTIIPIGLILNELISNALKYAFPDGRKGVLEVQLEQLEEGIKLSVKDNGVGVEKETLDIKQSTSMGYRIVNAFVKKLKAVMTVDHQEGTRIDILIPA